MRIPRPLSITLALVVAATAAPADSSRSVALRSGTIEPGRDAESASGFTYYVVRSANSCRWESD